MYEYPVTVVESEGAQLVFCPDIPEMHSVGDTLEQALREAEDGLVTALSIYVDQRRTIPLPSKRKKGQHLVYLPALVVAKVALWNAMQEQGLRKADLARLLGVKPPQVDRLVDFLHSSRIEQVEVALAALGKRIGVTVEAA
jgi:antitoxin HicB